MRRNSLNIFYVLTMLFCEIMLPGVPFKRHSRCFADSLILFVKLSLGDTRVGGRSSLSHSASDNGAGSRVPSDL